MTTFCPTTFCLMHSSGQGPVGWQLVVDELQRRGQRALTPAFDLGKTDEGLAFHAETIVEFLNAAGHTPKRIVFIACRVAWQHQLRCTLPL